MDTTLIVILVVLALVGYFLISLYNSLINAKNRVENSFAGIDVQLVKRYDLIPNLARLRYGMQTAIDEFSRRYRRFGSVNY